MTVNELKKYHEELNLPVGIRLEIMESYAERLEWALQRIRGKTMSHVVDASHGFQVCKEIARDALANAEAEARRQEPTE